MKTYPLHRAVLSANSEAVLVLIRMGASLNELDEQGHTPLHWAVFGGYKDIVRTLLEAGANPNTFSNDGVTPKWRACDFGLLEIEELLTGYGGRADTNEHFNKVAFQLFNELMSLPLPQVEKQSGVAVFINKWVQRAKGILGVLPVR
ncbi:MAG: ankyrin repeat domain-containing protein [Hymenobacter sp.]|nr:MAG: ankyrin repeat domain-containing protein [Hymenobacter sp.]